VGCDGLLLGCLRLGCARVINKLGHGADLGRSKRLGGLKQKKRKKEGEIDLKFWKRIQANEFKLRFEFNQTKIVLQHECNNKLLWFINLIKKNN
jgi:hypothetical protein